VIAISGYRALLHQAVYKGLEEETNDVIERYRKHHREFDPAALAQRPAGTSALDDARVRSTQQYAIITESLGSYVLLDALAAAGTPNNGIVAHQIACRASQIHMLANQVAMLRLSRTRVRAAPDTPLAQDEALLGPSPTQPKNCSNDASPRPYVVGYHDPSDLLTFYLFHPPAGAPYSFETQLNTTMINVVAPFAPEIVPFVLADPDQAHVSGQETDRRIQNMVSFGSNGSEPSEALAPDPGPAPAPTRR